MTRNEIVAQLKSGPQTVKFKKMNGETVTRQGTLDPDILEDLTEAAVSAGPREDSVNYWDLTKNAWRKFKVSSLISITS